MWLPVPGANPFSSPYVAFRKAMVIPREKTSPSTPIRGTNPKGPPRSSRPHGGPTTYAILTTFYAISPLPPPSKLLLQPRGAQVDHRRATVRTGMRLTALLKLPHQLLGLAVRQHLALPGWRCGTRANTPRAPPTTRILPPRPSVRARRAERPAGPRTQGGRARPAA